MKTRTRFVLSLLCATIAISCSEVVMTPADEGAQSDTTPQDVPVPDTQGDSSTEDAAATDVVLGPGCCGDDDDCAVAQTCANSAPGDPKGMCVSQLEAPGCYNENHCLDDQTCVGAIICSCDVPCFAPSSPGTCQGASPPDSSSPDDASPEPDAAADAIDDPGVDSSPVPDQSPPEDSDLQSGCCAADVDCPAGSQCVNTVCKQNAPAGMCWDNGDCPETHECQAAVVCGCNEECFFPDQPGLCIDITTPAKQLNECCDPMMMADPCAEGLVCYADWDIGPNVGTCVEMPGEGQCYDPSDCQSGLCKSGFFCTCDMDCNSMLGNCAAPLGCCANDSDCSENQACAVSDATPYGQCAQGLLSGQCYNDADCLFSFVCEGESLCPCNAMCFVPITPGNCSTPLPTE